MFSKKKNHFKLMFILTIALGQFFISALALSKDEAIGPTFQIASILKNTIHNLSPKEIYQLTENQYKKLLMMNEEGYWRSIEFAAINEQLLPDNFTAKQLEDFIDEMAIYAADNNYLMTFLNRAQQQDFNFLKEKVAQEGNLILPQALAYALALSRLTQAELDDPNLVRALLRFWEKERDKLGINFKEMPIFGYLKLHSVEEPIKKMLNSRHTKKISQEYYRSMLPINIIEAMVVDVYFKHANNASSAWPLVLNRPGSSNKNPIIGTGPVEFTSDMKRFLFRMSLPRQWADLYSTWNMAFVSNFPDFPFFMAKLLIPEVSNYKDKPEEYIYRRALALYTHVHYFSFDRRFNELKGLPPCFMNWEDKKLSDLWGKTNEAVAKEYAHSVYEKEKEAYPQMNPFSSLTSYLKSILP